MLWGAEIAQARMRLAGEVLRQRGGQSRFADARLAREQHDLSLTGLGLGPAPQEQIRFLFASDQGRQPARMQRLEAALSRTLPKRGERPRRRGDALQVLGTELGEFEQVA